MVDKTIQALRRNKRTAFFSGRRHTKGKYSRHEIIGENGGNSSGCSTLRVSCNYHTVGGICASLRAIQESHRSAVECTCAKKVRVSSSNSTKLASGIVVIFVQLILSKVQILLPIRCSGARSAKCNKATAILLCDNRLIRFFCIKANLFIVWVFKPSHIAAVVKNGKFCRIFVSKRRKIGTFICQRQNSFIQHRLSATSGNKCQQTQSNLHLS
mmetsp:Transcript_7582/g.13901  ORF Transcript_7582/g.13901 Transcript_7582/m.13901 type:complete len:213 (-) Transcript_7582:122-760(-)